MTTTPNILANPYVLRICALFDAKVTSIERPAEEKDDSHLPRE